MAISNKNILITPNTSGIFGNQPNVVFTGADSSIGDSAAITLTANPQNTGSVTLREHTHPRNTPAPHDFSNHQRHGSLA